MSQLPPFFSHHRATDYTQVEYHFRSQTSESFLTCPLHLKINHFSCSGTMKQVGVVWGVFKNFDATLRYERA